MADEEVVQSSGVARKVIGLLVVALAVALAGGLAYAGKGPADPWLGSVITPFWGTLTILESVALLSFAINFAAYIPAFALQTEKFYDLTGSLTYLTCTAYSFGAGYVASGRELRLRPVLASALTCVWALRLGSFLFARILKDGKDDRFDAIKPNPVRFLVAWTLQGLWVFLTAYAVYIANASTDDSTLGVLDIVGIAIWAVCFAGEVLADYQKRVWRRDPANKGKFIEYGLWYYSRHPNHFFEVALWTGMFLLCASTFTGSQWAAVISPVFIFCLIFFVSGVRLLEQKADRKWGGQPDYENYKATTSIFVPLPKLGKRVHAEDALAMQY